MKRSLVFVLVIAALIVLTGCVAGPNNMVDTPDAAGTVAGFWTGLWHGAIAPITFVVSLFNDNVNMYAVHNNGGWYNTGFLFALGAVWGGGGCGARRARHSK